MGCAAGCKGVHGCVWVCLHASLCWKVWGWPWDLLRTTTTCAQCPMRNPCSRARRLVDAQAAQAMMTGSPPMSDVFHPAEEELQQQQHDGQQGSKGFRIDRSQVQGVGEGGCVSQNERDEKVHAWLRAQACELLCRL